MKSGAGQTPLPATERGEPVAILVNPALLRPRLRTRTFLPEFAALMARPPGDNLPADLDAVRGDR